MILILGKNGMVQSLLTFNRFRLTFPHIIAHFIRNMLSLRKNRMEMGNWEKRQEEKKEVKESAKLTREVIAKYFLDLSKLVFTAIVLGGFVPIFTNNDISVSWGIVSIGSIASICLALLGYRILKQR